MSRLLGIALALIVLGGVAYFLFPHLRTGQEPVPSEIPAQPSVSTAEVRDESSLYMVDVKYPQFGLPAIDADIRNKIETSVAEFKALPPNPPESATPQNEFTGTFEDVYVGPDIISAKLILSQYTGGAHPMTIFSGVNYDRATGRQLLPQDAFALAGLSAEEVSARATAELKAKLGDSMFEEGADSNPENFSSFVISENEITFIFQPYQVAAYAAGVQQVSFKRVR
jgi:hypothetical protein